MSQSHESRKRVLDALYSALCARLRDPRLGPWYLRASRELEPAIHLFCIGELFGLLDDDDQSDLLLRIEDLAGGSHLRLVCAADDEREA